MKKVIFRGYVPLSGKECVMAFKNKPDSELLTYEQATRRKEFAGVLAKDIVLVDIDDFEQSETLYKIIQEKCIKCKVYATSRGKHFYFRGEQPDKCKTHAQLACGLIADIKLGNRNSYGVLKTDGVLREVLQDCEELETLPKWLMPISQNVDFLEMEAGDGRNQKLFNFILTLQANDFSNDEARECIQIINNYILSEPLEERELDVILREDSFKKPIFFKKNVFLFDVFAKYIKNNDRIIKINNVLHVYSNGRYISGDDAIESKMIEHIPNLKASQRAEVLKYLNLMIRKNTKTCEANFIAFRNGIYNIVDDSFSEFSPDKIVTNIIDHDYNPDATSQIVDNTFNKLACGDKNVQMLLEEAVGYCFYRRNELRKSFILIGDKKNGKSTYLAMIKELLGDENTAALDLSELGERFSSSSLFGILANIGDDIGDEFIANPSLFKKIVSGDRIKGENKGQKEFFFNPYCKLLFSANNIPRIKDKSGAVIDRLVIVPFDSTFSKDDPDFDPYIKYKLISEDALEYLILLGLKGLKRVLKNNSFTESERVKKSLKEYEENNNPVLLFFSELDECEVYNEPTKALYSKYSEFCLGNSFAPMSNIEFSKQVKKRFKCEIISKSIKGKRNRIFVKEV